MKQFNIRLEPHQIAVLKSKPNASEYVRRLIEKDQTKSVRRAYALQLITDWVAKDGLMNNAPTICLMLARQISGEDQLGELIERAGK